MDILKSGKASRLGRSRRVRSEIDRLDSVLTASLQAEEKDKRRRGRWVSIGFLLLLLTGVTVLAFVLPYFYTPLNVGRDPGDDEKTRSLVAEGTRHLEMGRVKEAGAKFRKALKLAPHLPEGWAALGSLHSYQFEYGKAEELLRKALTIDSRYEPALLGLGEIAYAEGRQDEVEALWQRCSNRTRLGHLYLAQSRFPEAARILAEEVRKKPGDESLRRLTDAARAGHLTPEIAVFIRPSLPPSRSPLAAKGWVLFSQGRSREAVPLFQKALAVDPGSVMALTGMGWTLFRSGRPRESLRYFDEALRVQPDDPVALNGRASCLKTQGRIEEAIKTWERMEEVEQSPSDATGALGWIYYQRGDCQRAAGYLARWISIYPENKQSIDALEDCLQKLNHRPTMPPPQTRP